MAQVVIHIDLEAAALRSVFDRPKSEVIPAQSLLDLIHVVKNVLALASAATIQDFDLDRTRG